jgi:riboflavin biosynthesis pyrimidine reductase
MDVAEEPLLEQLLPPGPALSADELCARMRPWEHGFADRPRVLCNMVATLDGLITVGGRSGPIGGPGDHALFHALRTVVDAVLIGTGTLRAERYGRLVRRPERRARRAALGLVEDPLAILITRRGELPWSAPLFEAPEQRIAVVGPAAGLDPPAHVRARIDVIDMPVPTPAAALRAVHEAHGVRAVLCEGGPTLNRSLLGDGVLDELFLTLGPLLAGGGEPDALRVLAGDAVEPPARAELRSVLRHGDELFLRYAL